MYYSETLYCWQFRIKGEVIKLLEKGKGEEEVDQTLVWIGPNPGEG
jgi:hypothetical protein